MSGGRLPPGELARKHGYEFWCHHDIGDERFYLFASPWRESRWYDDLEDMLRAADRSARRMRHRLSPQPTA